MIFWLAWDLLPLLLLHSQCYCGCQNSVYEIKVSSLSFPSLSRETSSQPAISWLVASSNTDANNINLQVNFQIALSFWNWVNCGSVLSTFTSSKEKSAAKQRCDHILLMNSPVNAANNFESWSVLFLWGLTLTLIIEVFATVAILTKIDLTKKKNSLHICS